MLNPDLIGVSSPETDLENLRAYERVSTKYSDIDTKIYQGTLEKKLKAFAALMALYKAAELTQSDNKTVSLDVERVDKRLANVNDIFSEKVREEKRIRKAREESKKPRPSTSPVPDNIMGQKRE